MNNLLWGKKMQNDAITLGNDAANWSFPRFDRFVCSNEGVHAIVSQHRAGVLETNSMAIHVTKNEYVVTKVSFMHKPPACAAQKALARRATVVACITNPTTLQAALAFEVEMTSRTTPN